MYDEEYRRPETLRRTRHRNSAPQPKQSSVSLTGIQTVLCALCIVAAVIIKVCGGGVYTKVHDGVSAAFNTRMTRDDISQVFNSLKEKLPDMKSVFSSSPSSSGASSAASGTSSASSSASSAVSSPSASSTSTAVSTASSALSVVSAVTVMAEGGEDLPAQMAGDGTLQTPATAMLGPYLLTVTPQWPITGDITSGFGYRLNPITQKISFHTGIDIASPAGTAIGAAMPGVVKETGTNAAYGNYVLLEHGEGVETFYGHSQKVLVSAGQRVKLGETVALVGSTGMSTGNHLHFEIRLNGITVNPMWALTVRE